MVDWVIRDFVARGENPPQGEGWSDKDWLVVPPGSFLAIAKHEMVRKILEHAPADVDLVYLEASLELARKVVSVKGGETLDGLKEDFSFFDPTGPADRTYPKEELERREKTFLSNLLLSLVRGNFLPLSDRLYQQALDGRFVLDIPIKVRFDRLDGAPIKSFLEYADSEEGAEFRKELGVEGTVREFINFPDEFEERAMVFHRGLAAHRTKGRFFMAKVDLWLGRILRVLFFPIIWPIEQFLKKKDSVVSEPDLNKGNPARRRWIRRLGLNDTPFSGLWSVSELQEPAFREMVVLFRQQKPEQEEEEAEGQGERRQLQIKIFRDIPLSDSEIVFPEFSAQMPTFDAVKLGITAIAAAPAVFRAATGGGGASLLLAVFLCIYISKVVGQYLRARKLRMARMTQELYYKTRDNDVGVLQYLVDAGQEQDFREIALVYGVLLAEQQALNANDLDLRVEAFLSDNFSGIDVDFEIDDALRKTAEGENGLGLIAESTGPDGQTLYTARPPSEVYKRLLNAWGELADVLSPDDGNARVPEAS